MEEDQLLGFLRAVGPVGSVEGAVPHVGSKLDNAMAEILSTVCREMEASHCVLWEASVDFDPRAASPTGRLYAVHSTFPAEQRIRHAAFPADLMLDLTGRYFWATSKRSDEAISFDNNILATDKDAQSTPFLREQGLTMGCTARWLLGAENSGAISVYRTAGAKPFGDADVRKLGNFALYVPKLLNLATNQFVADLMSSVLDALYNSNAASFPPDTQESHFTSLDEVCRRLTEMFVCEEASVFLTDHPKREEVYRLMGSNMPRMKIHRQSYTASPNCGLTGYVLATRRPVVVFAEDKLDAIRDFYVGIRWMDGAGLSEGQQSWSAVPRGFLGVPIFGLEATGDEARPLLGVVRCSIRTGRYYFSRRDTEILEIVARLIGVWWVRWLGAAHRAERQQLWENMAKISDSLNEQVHHVLTGVKALEDRLVIPTTQAQLIGLYDSVVRQFRTTIRGVAAVAFRQVAERQLNIRSCDPGRETITALAVWRHAAAAAAEAMLTGEPIPRRLWGQGDTPSDQDMVLVCAPVSIAGTHFGVLDFVFDDTMAFDALADSLMPWVRTIGRQLALCEFLIQQVVRLEELKASQIQTYANMAHQLKSPLLTAVSRSRSCLDYVHSARGAFLPSHLTADLEKLAGACRKTQRVADTMEMLARLVQGRRITPKLEEVSPDQIFRFGREMLQDQLNRYEDSRRLQVDYANAAEEVRRLHRHSVRCDPRFIQQAMDAVIDNAFKYSADGSTVRFSLQRGAKFELLIRVTNTGIWLTEEDAARCTERSFRGEEAQLVDQDGSGLGLWLAKELMKIQNGRIKAYRTNEQGETTFEIGTMLVVSS